MEDVFERLKGVNWAVSGYAGGIVPYPSYEMVHEGTTGHAEAVMVEYDPNLISYEQLLKVFWKTTIPTSTQSARSRRRPPISLGDLLSQRRSRKSRTEVLSGTYRARVYRSPNCDPAHPDAGILPGGRVPPELLRRQATARPRAGERRHSSKAKKTQAKAAKPSATTTASPRGEAETAAELSAMTVNLPWYCSNKLGLHRQSDPTTSTVAQNSGASHRWLVWLFDRTSRSRPARRRADSNAVQPLVDRGCDRPPAIRPAIGRIARLVSSTIKTVMQKRDQVGREWPGSAEAHPETTGAN